MLGAQQQGADLVRAAVNAICASAVLRRHLRYEPARGLAELGLSGPVPVCALASPTLGLAPDLSDASLLGVSGAISPNTALPLELRLVIYGVRPAALVCAPAGTLADILTLAREHGLVALVSPEEFVPEAVLHKGGFADRAARVRPVRGDGAGSSLWWRRVTVSSSAHLAALAWLAQLLHWDVYLGQLLGYPVCCSSAFAANWPDAYAHYGGDVGAVALHVGFAQQRVVTALPWQTNTWARYFGDVLIAHFPCELRCLASIALADRMLEALSWHEGVGARAVRARLAQPLLLTEDYGLFRFADGRLRRTGGVTSLHFTDAQATDHRADELLARMRAAGRVTIASKSDGFKIPGSEAVRGRLLTFDQEVADALPVAS